MCEFSEKRRTDGHTLLMRVKWLSALNFLHISQLSSVQYGTGNLCAMPSTDSEFHENRCSENHIFTEGHKRILPFYSFFVRLR